MLKSELFVLPSFLMSDDPEIRVNPQKIKRRPRPTLKIGISMPKRALAKNDAPRVIRKREITTEPSFIRRSRK